MRSSVHPTSIMYAQQNAGWWLWWWWWLVINGMWEFNTKPGVNYCNCRIIDDKRKYIMYYIIQLKSLLSNKTSFNPLQCSLNAWLTDELMHVSHWHRHSMIYIWYTTSAQTYYLILIYLEDMYVPTYWTYMHVAFILLAWHQLNVFNIQQEFRCCTRKRA